MNGVVASNKSSAFSGRGTAPLVSKYADGRIHVETKIKLPEARQTSPMANTRFQAANRAGLLTAVSLASLMGATAASGQEGGLQLPTIDVTGDQGGYQATQQTITRLPTPLRDMPQTVNVVPQQVIQDQRATSMEDALRNIPGITFSAGEGGQQGDAPFIRGQAARGDIFRDGMRDPGWYTRDLFNIDRVEVYKGPSAFAFGRGATGGAINNVSKLPAGATFNEVTATGSSAGGFRVDADASGKKGAVSGRVSALYQDVDTADRDNVWTKRWGVAPSVAFDITDRTKATLSYIYQGEESVPDYGHPWLPAPTANVTTGAVTGGYNGNGSAVTPVQVSRSNWYGFASGPLRDLVQTDTHIVTAKLEHEFSNALKLSNATRYVYVDRMARPTAPRTLNTAGGSSTIPVGYSTDLMTIGRQHFETNTDNQMLVNQTDVVAKFDTGGFKHTMVGGVELAHEDRSQSRWNLCYPATGGTTPAGAPICRTSLASPDPNASAGSYFAQTDPNRTKQNTIAVYASDQIKINRYFELLGAARFDNFQTDYTSGATSLSASDNLFSYRFGGVYHPTENSSVWAAYGVSYNPSAELGTLSNGNVSLDPEENHTIESGVKVDVLNGKLSLTGAVFNTEKMNMRVANDPTLPNAQQVQILDGVARVSGIELGATGQITDKWRLTAGYGYTESEIKSSTNAAERGKQLPNTPPHAFTLWTTYDVTPAWVVGGGAFYASKDFANTTNTQYVDSYWRLDMMTSYKLTEKVTLQLNIYNLTDEFYYAQYYGGHAVPAAGRYATLSLKARW
jgi:catecholate siderophore receptor